MHKDQMDLYFDRFVVLFVNQGSWSMVMVMVKSKIHGQKRSGDYSIIQMHPPPTHKKLLIMTVYLTTLISQLLVVKMSWIKNLCNYFDLSLTFVYCCKATLDFSFLVHLLLMLNQSVIKQVFFKHNSIIRCLQESSSIIKQSLPKIFEASKILRQFEIDRRRRRRWIFG